MVARVDFTAAEFAKAKRIITDPNDGPLTAFVLMARATRLPDDARNAAADALFEAMAELGYLTPEADDINCPFRFGQSEQFCSER